MNIVFLDRSTLGDDLDTSVLGKYGRVIEYPITPPVLLKERVEDADVIVINKIKVNESLLENAKRLRLVCEFATGYDNIDLELCRERGVAVCNVVGYSTDSVAQITLATVLNLYCHLPEYVRATMNGEYTKGGVANILVPPYRELFGKTWGVVGYGNIGRAVGRVAKALGCKVIVNKRTPCEDAEIFDIDTLCREADIITLHTPLNDGTRGIISRERISNMKDGVVIVNEARGAIWDESAVRDGVLSGKIGAIGCDVFSYEPFDEKHPFWSIKGLDNVCLTPHMAWAAYEARCRCLSETEKNIISFLSGGDRNRVDLK